MKTNKDKQPDILDKIKDVLNKDSNRRQGSSIRTTLSFSIYMRFL